MEEQLDQQIASALSTPEGEPVPLAAVQPEPVQPAPQQAPPQVPQQEAPKVTYSPVWEQLKNRLSTQEAQWDIPEKVKTGTYDPNESELDFLLKTIYDNTDFGNPLEKIDDPLIKSYLVESQSPEFKRDEWFKKQIEEINVQQLPSDQFLFSVYKKYADENKTGWTDEVIQEHINSMNAIQRDMEANNIRKQMKDNEDAKLSKQQERVKEERSKYFETMNQQRVQEAQRLIESKRNTGEIFGLKVSQAERDEFNKVFPELIKIDPEKGMHRIAEVLQSDNSLFYDIAYLLWKGVDGIRGHISEIKEGTKDNVIEKLRLQPRQEGGVVPSIKDVNPEDFKAI